MMTMLLVLLPLLLVLAASATALQTGLSGAAWQALAADAQWQQALLYSVGTGVVSSLTALALCLWVLSQVFGTPVWHWSVRALPAMLALPHAAFAIGMFALISPTGWLIRMLAPVAGWQDPPAWPTVQDPWGASLTLVLVLKETPFLLWASVSLLQRDDFGPRMARELQTAHTFGHSTLSAWWRVAVPQLLPRLQWPLLAVLAYGLTVVDLAQITGPGSPPTLSSLAWQWLQSPDEVQIAQGAAAGWVLTLCLAGLAGLCWAISHGGSRGDSCGAWPVVIRRWWTRGVARTSPISLSWLALAVLCLPYVAVVAALLVGSVTGVWHFPALWPQGFTLSAWANVQSSPAVLYNTISLGLVSAGISLVWAVAWLELLPPRWDARLRPVVYMPLVLPAVLWVVGIHGLALRAGLDSSWAGILMAHSVAVMPYTLIALSPAYQGFDVRLRHTASSLGHGHWRFLLQIKWPLLRAALCAAFAVGFAVSVAQYLPTLYVGGGRISTVTTEAVTLASGGQRSLSAAFAWVQWVLPAMGFGIAAWAGRPRWKTT